MIFVGGRKMRWRAIAVGGMLLVAGCGPAPELPARAVDRVPDDPPNEAGLVPLPCDRTGAVRPARPFYCTARRHFVTPAAREAIHDAAKAMGKRFPGAPVTYMEASWPSGKAPMPPHLSHGDGHQVDISIYYETLDGKPLAAPYKTWTGFNAFEPPRKESERVSCPKGSEHEKGKDPDADRKWRMDETRTRALLKIFVEDKRVRRVLIEPHLEKRLGFDGHPKVRFAGCNAARHDDHLHVDFY
jgi:hypothetical protein